jgi:hypothetical protein
MAVPRVPCGQFAFCGYYTDTDVRQTACRAEMPMLQGRLACVSPRGAIDDQLDLGGRLHRQLGRFLTAKNAIDVRGSELIALDGVCSV